MISSPIWLSRFPVGSSASSILRIADDRARYRDPLLLPARKLGREVMDARVQAHAVQRLERAPAASPSPNLSIEQWDLDVVDDAEVADEMKGLKDKTDFFVSGPRETAILNESIALPFRLLVRRSARPAAR